LCLIISINKKGIQRQPDASGERKQIEKLFLQVTFSRGLAFPRVLADGNFIKVCFKLAGESEGFSHPKHINSPHS
jgi:hypothetical protein